MITNLPKEQLVLLGQNVSARRVIDQARYTLGLVSIDEAMKGSLGPEFISEATAAVESLETSLRDRYAADGHALRATQAQEQLVLEARRYRRALVQELKIARRRGVDLTVQVEGIGYHGENPSALAQDLERLVSTAMPLAESLTSSGLPQSFLEEGRLFVQLLRESEKEQELAKRKLRRDAITRMREFSGIVVEAIRTIVQRASMVHRHDLAAASRYSLGILRSVAHGPVAIQATPPSAAA